MVALTSFSISTVPTNPLSPFQKPNSSLPFQQPKKLLSPITKTKLQFEVFSTSTPISSKPLDPPAPDLEVKGDPEKFNWYEQWYALAPVCDLDKRTPHARKVLGIDVVIWWDKIKEKWQVFGDMCPHRLAPLSEGRIDQWGRLQCVYHGWCFDGAGDCKLIPQAPPEGPPLHTFKKACASVYPSVEQNRIVWFWPSTDPQYKDILMKKKPPFFQEVEDPSYSSLMGTREISYGYEVLVENLMDPSHVPYAHYGIISLPAKAKSRRKVDREGGRPLQMTVETLNISGFLAKNEYGISEFIAPCTYYAYPTRSGSSNGSVPSGSIKEESSAPQKQKSAVLLFICIPVSPGRSRLIWAFPRNFAIWLDRVIPRWIFHVRQNLILDSDLYLVHLEEHKIVDAGSSNWQKACYTPTKADALVVAFRKWLRKHASDQVDWRNKFQGGLPPTPPKEQLMDRYWSHVVHCTSCRAALKGLKALEVSLQVISLALVGIVAAVKQHTMTTIGRNVMVSMAVLCFLASKWLSYFIYKNFYFHDYNHAFK